MPKVLKKTTFGTTIGTFCGIYNVVTPSFLLVQDESTYSILLLVAIHRLNDVIKQLDGIACCPLVWTLIDRDVEYNIFYRLVTIRNPLRKK